MLWLNLFAQYLIFFISHLHNNESAKGPNLQRWHMENLQKFRGYLPIFFGKKVLHFGLLPAVHNKQIYMHTKIIAN